MRRGRAPARALIGTVVALSGIGAAPAAAAPDQVDCMRAQKPPEPPPGGVVFARPLQGGASPNVVVIPAGASWTPSGFCASGQEVMSNPSSIEVGANGALLLRGSARLSNFGGRYEEYSAWGARDDKSDPALSDTGVWERTIEARAVEPKYLLNEFNSCRDCELAGVVFNPAKQFPSNSFKNNLNGADLRGATLRGTYFGWKFEGADLRGADLSETTFHAAIFERTRIDRADFSGASLSVVMNAVRFDSPPLLANLDIGCTVFKDSDLSGTGLSIRRLGRCLTLPGSTAPLNVLAEAARLRASDTVLDFDATTFVATAENHAALAGADLTGLPLDRASFVGFPADLRKTDFSRAHLQRAGFDRADLSGADFKNANLAGASFRGADLSGRGTTFAGAATDLSRANFIDADVSGASFVAADLSSAVFSHALAEGTNFNGVRAPKAVFSGAHIYGDGRAFDSADNLQGADFSGAVLAGDVDEGGGFNFTHADLAGATFNGAQCVGCNFTRATLGGVNFIGAYLPGAIFTDVESMSGARLHDAWLYCGDRDNSACAPAGSSGERWSWVLELGSAEDYGPVPFRRTKLGNAPLNQVATCPDGKSGLAAPAGCGDASLLPPENREPPIPAACSAAGSAVCPTPTSTLLDSSTLGAPTALAAVSPADWTTNAGNGVYVAIDNGTIQRVEGREQRRVAGQPGKLCDGGACGDGGPAKDAVLGEVREMAIGLDGSLYLAEPGLHRVRRIDPSGRITTVAGSGLKCVQEIRGRDCGNGYPATDARLAGPYGVWVDPGGRASERAILGDLDDALQEAAGVPRARRGAQVAKGQDSLL